MTRFKRQKQRTSSNYPHDTHQDYAKPLPTRKPRWESCPSGFNAVCRAEFYTSCVKIKEDLEPDAIPRGCTTSSHREPCTSENKPQLHAQAICLLCCSTRDASTVQYGGEETAKRPSALLSLLVTMIPLSQKYISVVVLLLYTKTTKNNAKTRRKIKTP